MIHLEIDIDDLNYDALLRALLPIAGDKLTSSDHTLSRLLSSGDSQSAAKALLHILPQAQKDKLAAELINGNSAKIGAKIEKLAKSQGLDGRVTHVGAEARP